MQWNARPIAIAFALVAGIGAARAQEIDPASDATTAPHATSQSEPGDGRYDAVGYATVRAIGAAAVAISPTLPAESYAEVTALDSGRTILVRIQATAATADFLAALSEGAAQQLGVGVDGPIAVRIRAVRPSAEDQAALRRAGAAQARIDSPPALLRALRLQLPAPAEPATVSAPLPPPPPPPLAERAFGEAPTRANPPHPRQNAIVAPPKPAQGRFLVQVAALSSLQRAQTLAQKLHGFVKAGSGLYRVQLGPFATAAAAEQARVEAVRAGFGDARRTSVR